MSRQNHLVLSIKKKSANNRTIIQHIALLCTIIIAGPACERIEQAMESCSTADDCPGADSACLTRTCDNHVCGALYAPAGTLIADPTVGDCLQSQCDGRGQEEVVPSDSDVPVDGDQCTADVCSDGVAS